MPFYPDITAAERFLKAPKIRTVLALLGLISAITYTGHDVLVTGERPIAAYMQTQASPRGATHLDIWEVSGGQTVLAYDANMTKLLHTVVVSDDLRAFAHIHPVLHPNGHFTIDIRPAKGERYHVYIDGDPRGLGRQVFRFDVPSGSPRRARARTPNPSGATAHAGPYEVRLDSTTVSPGSIATLHVTILERGKPATDLHPYLGAVAHGVFVGLHDLSYMHGHGMDEQMLAMATANDCGDAMMAATPPLAPNAAVPNRFVMQVLAPRPQPYDLWLQFTGGRTVYTVPFLITAVALLGASSAPAPISVLYAGSLVTPMENAVRPALLARGIAFNGEPGGSKKLANFIRDGIRTPDIFISVDPALVKGLGDRVARATTFANTTLGVAWSDKSRFAAQLGATDSARVRYILSLPGIRIGRTDPQLDPKGRYTVDAMALIGGAAILGAAENSAQVFPEEDLLARIDTGEIDAGFFYKTEAVARGLHFVALPGKAAMSDRISYTLAVMRNAPHLAAAAAFERFILTGQGRTLLIEAGLRYR